MEPFETTRISKPSWLKRKLPGGKTYITVKDIVTKNHLHTICESGNCPNIGECWGVGTATFLILGDICTRSCRFCAVKTGRPNPVDLEEPKNIAQSVFLMKLQHCVITSVDRDDLEDGGSAMWVEIIREIRKVNPETTIETLIPDFRGRENDIKKIAEVAPEVVSHNLETVNRLTKKVRNFATYKTSLKVLSILKEAGMVTKSGIMVGLGETNDEIFEAMDDLINAGCDIFTIGQYLQPTLQHLPVERFVSPIEFEEFEKIGLRKGFKIVESAPLVRSSYHAAKHLFAKKV